MAVIETGIIVNGIPIYTTIFDDKTRPYSNTILKSALLSAIQSIVKMLYGEQSKEFIFKKNRIFLDYIELQNTIIYAVCDLDSKLMFPIKSTTRELCNITGRLLLEGKINQHDSKRNYFILNPIVRDLFKDLSISATERLEQLF